MSRVWFLVGVCVFVCLHFEGGPQIPHVYVCERGRLCDMLF